MNPCCKLALVTGVKYLAVGDMVYSVLAFAVIGLQIISISKNGLAVNKLNVPLEETSINGVLVTYLIIGAANFLLALVLYRGAVKSDLQHCLSAFVPALLSTLFGFATVVYHGFQLSQLDMSLFNSEFFVSLGYHIFKLYFLAVVAAYIRELREFIQNDDKFHPTVSCIKRNNYQSILSSSEEYVEEREPAGYVFYNVAFTAKRYILEEKLKIDDTFLEYDEKTSILKGTYQPTADSTFVKDVAIKVLRSSFRSEENMTCLVKEAKLLFSIGSHQHILQLLGITATSSETNRTNIMLVMEGYPPRRLDDFLRTSFENRLQNFMDTTVQDEAYLRKRLGTVYENLEVNYYQLEPFSTVNMIQWAYQLSSAMDFLHSKKIVVGNVQAKSLILGRISCVKLSNFAFAAELKNGNNVVSSSQLLGKVSWKWLPPECLSSMNLSSPAEFNEKTDVWSYGCTLLEMFNMGYAPSMSPTLSEYLKALQQGKRPERPQFCSDGIYNLMKTCWSQEPSERPHFKFLSLFFRELLTTSMHRLF